MLTLSRLPHVLRPSCAKSYAWREWGGEGGQYDISDSLCPNSSIPILGLTFRDLGLNSDWGLSINTSWCLKLSDQIDEGSNY